MVLVRSLCFVDIVYIVVGKLSLVFLVKVFYGRWAEVYSRIYSLSVFRGFQILIRGDGVVVGVEIKEGFIYCYLFYWGWRNRGYCGVKGGFMGEILEF